MIRWLISGVLVTAALALTNAALAEPVSVEAVLTPKEQIRLDFKDGSGHFVLLVRREGVAEEQRQVEIDQQGVPHRNPQRAKDRQVGEQGIRRPGGGLADHQGTDGDDYEIVAQALAQPQQHHRQAEQCE